MVREFFVNLHMNSWSIQTRVLTIEMYNTARYNDDNHHHYPRNWWDISHSSFPAYHFY
jgi:hypothetical protein